MKKLVSLLFVLSSFTLIGCNQSSVSYKEVDSVDEYFTEAKVQAAKDAYASEDKTSIIFKQNYTGMDYKVIWEMDTNYFYEDSYQAINIGSQKSISRDKTLYLGSEVVEDCKYYIVEDGNNHEEKSGEEAVSKYNSSRVDVRKNIANGIGNPTYFLANIVSFPLDDAAVKYYLGSDNTLKYVFSNKDYKLNAYLIVDINTLVVTKLYVKYITMVDEKNSLTITSSMSASLSCSKHKTLEDIGWKQA